MRLSSWIWVIAVLGISACSEAEIVEDGSDLHARVGDSRAGAVLYQDYCAACHGRDGRGDGVAAAYLLPFPRDFSLGRFHLVSTDNGNPSDEDLLNTLRNGVPGSAMPAWDWMEAAELRDLVAFLREIVLEHRVDDLIPDHADQDFEAILEDAHRMATEQLRPGAPIDLGPAAPASANRLSRGKQLYASNCAACHGVDGRGSGQGPFFNAEGTLVRARDFTQGWLQGGVSEEAIATRILAGMPGTAMGAIQLEDPEDARAIAAYVRTWIDTERHDRLAQKRQAVTALRAKGTLPTTVEDPAWERAPSSRLPLMPLRWRPDFTEEVRVKALHDEQEIVFLFEWDDASPDDRLVGQSFFPDALACMFSPEARPAMLTMGSHDRPVSIWQWKAAWHKDVSGALDMDVRRQFPHEFLSADAAMPQTSDRTSPDRMEDEDARMLEADGPGHFIESRDADATQSMRGSWRDGKWHLIARRPLEVEEGVSLTPSETTFFSMAVWDGGVEDHAGQKAITVWHRLRLD